MKSLNSLRTLPVFLVIVMLGSLAGCVSQQQQERDAEAQKARARAHTDLGSVYYQQRQYEIALEEFTEATKIDPNFALAYNGLGLVHSALGQYDLADADFRKSIQLEPNNSESHNNYGGFLCSKGRYDESLKEFLAAVQNPLYSTPAVAYANAGICSIRNNDVVKGEIYLKQALQKDPLMGSAAYQLALLQFNKKDPVAAKSTLQNLMLTNPSPEMLWLAIQIERALGTHDAEASYALQLRRKYPDSEQAKLLQSGK